MEKKTDDSRESIIQNYAPYEQRQSRSQSNGERVIGKHQQEPQDCVKKTDRGRRVGGRRIGRESELRRLNPFAENGLRSVIIAPRLTTERQLSVKIVFAFQADDFPRPLLPDVSEPFGMLLRIGFLFRFCSCLRLSIGLDVSILVLSCSRQTENFSNNRHISKQD